MNSASPSLRKIIWVTVFSAAMAYLESSVVVYLRMIYYPEGFHFPLKPMPGNILFIEAGRELSTLIMLAATGWIAGSSFYQRISFFFYSFGVWDIFYYVWLKVFLNWPLSILDDDILFLIPVPWVGPVLAPVIVSVTFITAVLLFFYSEQRGVRINFSRMLLTIAVTGMLVIFIAFIWETLTVQLLEVTDPGFPWILFMAGEGLLAAGVLLSLKELFIPVYRKNKF